MTLEESRSASSSRVSIANRMLEGSTLTIAPSFNAETCILTLIVRRYVQPDSAQRVDTDMLLLFGSADCLVECFS